MAALSAHSHRKAAQRQWQWRSIRNKCEEMAKTQKARKYGERKRNEENQKKQRHKAAKI